MLPDPVIAANIGDNIIRRIGGDRVGVLKSLLGLRTGGKTPKRRRQGRDEESRNNYLL
jgi:hypothetical protein